MASMLMLVLGTIGLSWSLSLGASYNDILGDLSRLYRMQRYDYYDDGLSNRNADDEWSEGYRDESLQEPELFSGASIRDQEYNPQTPLWGYQSVSGGTGDQDPKEIKTDKVLPAYCNPPNPCPVGYTADDNCIEQFENTPDNNRRLLEEQDCPCDAEHMFQCPAGKDKIDSKSGEDNIDKMLSELAIGVEQEENLDIESEDENPYFYKQEKMPRAAKKGAPRINM